MAKNKGNFKRVSADLSQKVLLLAILNGEGII
jgi:hypothetical protein